MRKGGKRRYRCPTQKASYPQFVESVVAFIDQIRHDMQQPMMTGIALPGASRR
jgi:fructokinase